MVEDNTGDRELIQLWLDRLDHLLEALAPTVQGDSRDHSEEPSLILGELVDVLPAVERLGLEWKPFTDLGSGLRELADELETPARGGLFVRANPRARSIARLRALAQKARGMLGLGGEGAVPTPPLRPGPPPTKTQAALEAYERRLSKGVTHPTVAKEAREIAKELRGSRLPSKVPNISTIEKAIRKRRGQSGGRRNPAR